MRVGFGMGLHLNGFGVWGMELCFIISLYVRIYEKFYSYNSMY